MASIDYRFSKQAVFPAQMLDCKAKAAIPITYADKNNPPSLIIHGEKDDLVSPKQSQLLSSWLNIEGVPNGPIIVKDAPHFGPMFDTDKVKNKVLNFLRKELD